VFVPALRTFATDRLGTRLSVGSFSDVVLFALNLLVFPFLVRALTDGARSAGDAGWGDLVLLALFGGAFALPMVASVLKRHRFHVLTDEVLPDEERAARSAAGFTATLPWLFVHAVVIGIVAMATAVWLVLGERASDDVRSLIAYLAVFPLAMVQAVVVHRYFRAPRATTHGFLMSRQAEYLGNAAVFGTMLIYQLGWNLVTTMDLDAPSGPAEILGRLLFVGFACVLVYLPPRIFFTADDRSDPIARITRTAAPLPVAFRIVFGIG
jgi:hypothetical protein